MKDTTTISICSICENRYQNEAEELDGGSPVELGRQYRGLKEKLNNLTVLGGCCGTDHRHIKEICKAFVPQW